MYQIEVERRRKKSEQAIYAGHLSVCGFSCSAAKNNTHTHHGSMILIIFIDLKICYFFHSFVIYFRFPHAGIKSRVTLENWMELRMLMSFFLFFSIEYLTYSGSSSLNCLRNFILNSFEHLTDEIS